MLKLHFLKSISYALVCVLFAVSTLACTPLIPTSPAHSQTESQIIINKVDATSDSAFAIDQPTVINNYYQSGECVTIPNQDAYQLGVDDIVSIKIFGEPDLSGKYTVQDTGKIAVPLIGETQLIGCTLSQVEGLLYQKFTDGYLINPSISVALDQSRPIYILGEVKEPGKYDYISDMNILKAVALAGGFTYRANKKTAKIVIDQSSDKPKYYKIDIAQKIKPGDIIVIKERFF